MRWALWPMRLKPHTVRPSRRFTHSRSDSAWRCGGEKEKGVPVVESGKVYVLNLSAVEDDTDYEAKASVKRLILSGGHELHILSDNTKYPPRTVDLRRVRFIQGLVLGQPVKLIRDL